MKVQETAIAKKIDDAGLPVTIEATREEADELYDAMVESQHSPDRCLSCGSYALSYKGCVLFDPETDDIWVTGILAEIEPQERIKLSTLIKAWEQVHLRDTGDLGFCDFERALAAAGVDVVNDIEDQQQPRLVYRNECKP